MKNKFTLMLIIALLSAGTCSIAHIAGFDKLAVAPVPEMIKTTREIVPETKPESEPDNSGSVTDEFKSGLTEEFLNEMRTCKPYNEKYEFDFMGINLYFKIKIDGWVEERCSYQMSLKVKSLSKDFRNSFNVKVKDSEISKIEPQIKCSFNKDQLNLLIDTIIEEDKRSTEQINKMLENPDEITLPSANELTSNEKKLMEMITTGNVCSIPNIDEVMQQFSKLEQKK